MKVKGWDIMLAKFSVSNFKNFNDEIKFDLDDVSFVFIDEFDAFYHNQLARYVVGNVIEKKAEALLTTHNIEKMYKAGSFEN